MKALSLIATLYLVALPISLGAMEILAPLLMVTTLGMWGYCKLRSKPLDFQWSLPLAFWPLAVLWAVTFAGVFWNHLPQANAIHAVGKMRWILIYFFLHNIFSNLRYWEDLPKKLLYLSPLLSLIAIYAFSQFWMGWDFIRGEDFQIPIAYHPNAFMTRWRSIGFFNSPLTYGYSFAGITCLMAPLYYQKVRLKNNGPLSIGLMLSFLIFLASIGTTYSRGVWLGLLGGLFVVFFELHKKLCLGFMALLFVGLAAYTPFNAELRERITSMVDLNYTSNLERLKIWRANWELVKSSPVVGVGYEYNDVLIAGVYEKLNITGAPASHAHSTYMQFLAGTGFLGLGLFLSFLFLLLRQTWVLINNTKAPYLLFGIMGLHISILIGGLTECNFKDAEVNHLFIFFAAVVSAQAGSMIINQQKSKATALA